MSVAKYLHLLHESKINQSRILGRYEGDLRRDLEVLNAVCTSAALGHPGPSFPPLLREGFLYVSSLEISTLNTLVQLWVLSFSSFRNLILA